MDCQSKLDRDKASSTISTYSSKGAMLKHSNESRFLKGVVILQAKGDFKRDGRPGIVFRTMVFSHI